jgi:uncharacterized Tic20 family protein
MSEVEQEVRVVEVVDGKPRGETRKLEEGAEVPKPRPRRAETKKLAPDPDMALEVVAPVPHLGLSREEMSWAALAHASILLTLLLGLASGGLAAILGPIVPAIIWYVFRDKSEYVVEQARQATLFQLAGIVALLVLTVFGTLLVGVGWAVSAVLVLVLIGLILLPIMLLVTLLWIVAIIALPIVQVVYGCYAAIEAFNGRPVRYWWVADMIDRYQARV